MTYEDLLKENMALKAALNRAAAVNTATLMALEATTTGISALRAVIKALTEEREQQSTDG